MNKNGTVNQCAFEKKNNNMKKKSEIRFDGFTDFSELA